MKILCVVLITSLMLITFNATAAGYAGIYNSQHLSTTSQNNVESSTETPIATILMGAEFGDKYGASGELFFNGSGGGAAVGVFAKVSDFTLSTGVISVPDYSVGKVPGFNDKPDTNNGEGLYLGVKYKMLSIRYINYDVTHNYSARKQIGTTGTPPNEVPVYQSASSEDKLTREIIWIGAVLPF